MRPGALLFEPLLADDVPVDDDADEGRLRGAAEGGRVLAVEGRLLPFVAHLLADAGLLLRAADGGLVAFVDDACVSAILLHADESQSCNGSTSGISIFSEGLVFVPA